MAGNGDGSSWFETSRTGRQFLGGIFWGVLFLFGLLSGTRFQRIVAI